MSERIADGKGRGYEAEVNHNNKLEVFSVSENEIPSLRVIPYLDLYDEVLFPKPLCEGRVPPCRADGQGCLT